MSKKPTEPDKSRRRRRGVAAQLRHQAVMEKAFAGKGPTEIAKEVGLSRQTVSEILNSDEVKEKVKQINAKLATGIDTAIATILRAVRIDYYAARDLLQNFGYMKQKMDLAIGTTLEDLVLGSMKEDDQTLKGQ